MKTVYAVLGSGMQGTAAAYDLAKFGEAAAIKMGDMCATQAEKSAHRVNQLTGDTLCEHHQVDAMDDDSLNAFLEGSHILLSCVPYWMHPRIAKAAIAKGVHMVDLGGNTDITMETLHMDESAKAAGVTCVPDTGLAPGLVNSLGSWMIENIEKCDTVKLYCGVLPQHPQPPFNYKLTFNVEGLVTEYDYEAVALRNNEITMIPTLTETEELHIEQLGQMEAFVTSGGTSTAPYTHKGKVTNYEYKTIRHPGHGFLMKIFKDFGFWSEELVDVRGVQVRPKDVFNAVFGPNLDRFKDDDLCAIRAVGIGTENGQPCRKQIDIFDKQCPTTGFTSMERLTGFSMAIYAKEIADGNVKTGCVRYEDAVSGTKFVEEIQKRGIALKFS